MKKTYLLFAIVIATILSGCGTGSGANEMNMTSQTSPEQPTGNDSAIVDLPENYTDGVIYTTVNRGNAHEKLYASPETIEAVQNGEPIPQGTVLTLEIYRDEVLSDIFVMEKRLDWGDQPAEEQNGDWRFQAYNADQSLNTQRDVASCISCHASQERDDFVYTFDEMKTFQLEDFTGAIEDTTSSAIDESKINALPDYLVSITNVDETA
ncbi:cytochrome P460 family protein [Paenibacillus sp. LHD-117]|uniref:cytochrome P460 family protein n=1 Tax=Paenibacillus sp. LHD-117 TaxID=3071412 RepID=UPI0027E01A15|nr:cytochrome P460 family protein [Paenibacillus sp. LHD-117]MDQ6423414.1 cytochrome P460 family protein [Paenibacillus sp. LHD-117]